MNFWQKIKAEKGMILALSPMDGVSDHPFRWINKKYGKPDLIFTEFASAEGVCHSRNPKILNHFDFDNSQRPLIAQIFGKTPASFKQTAVLLCELGVDGIDINMGCPAKTVAHNGSGAALIKTPELAKEIIKSVQEGIREWGEGLKLESCEAISNQMIAALKHKKELFGLSESNRNNLPTVSVKTRIGVDENQVLSWLPNLIAMQPAAISLHGRTLKQSYSGLADWEVIARAVELVKKEDPSIVFLGNGDVKNYEEALEKVKRYGVDGVLLGRASFGNPLVFLPKAEREKFLQENNIFQIALEHAKLFEATYKPEDGYGFLPMRKHLAWYTKGIEAAAATRSELVRCNNATEVEEILRRRNLLDF